MKKLLSILVISMLAVLAFVVGGCSKKESPMQEKSDITLRGRVGDKSAVNPAFDWTNDKDDSSFTVTLTDSNNKTVASGETAEPHFELATALAYGKKYTLTVTGAESGKKMTLRFETVSGSGTPNLKRANISLCEPFRSHMVLQRGKAIEITGKTLENTLVTLDAFGTRYYAVSDASGAFSVSLPAMAASATPTDIEFRLSTEKKLVLEDVLIGDVYLIAGQSNVQRGLTQDGADISDYTAQDIEDAAACDVRYYTQIANRSSTPLDTTLGGDWFKVSGSKAYVYNTYSAVAFLVGEMVGKELVDEGVPVGVLFAAKGDTNIVSWIGKDYYDGDAAAKNERYNAMIYPLRHTEISGVVWYQGCNNWAKGNEYEGLLKSLFANWRDLFRNDALPFFVVQLPVYDTDNFIYVRESQYLACAADENAYLIATCDGGDTKDIHPKQKRYLCERVAKSILSVCYDAPYLPESPTYLSHVTEGNRLIVTVKNGEGLHATGDEIVGFLLAGADGKYFDATATISDGKIVLTSENVPSPVSVKYGFSRSPFLNLYNKDGFLMSPFRTDIHNHWIDLMDYTSAAYYRSKADGSEMTHSVVKVGDETGTRITKAGDGKEYGALQLLTDVDGAKASAIEAGTLTVAKGGSICFEATGMKLRVVGSNSGAEILFRIEEGAGEIWAYSFTDDFVGAKDFLFPISEFRCVYNSQDGIVDTQRVAETEVWIKAPDTPNTDVTITILEARFVDIDRTAPTSFRILEAKNDGHDVAIRYSESVFASSYRVIVSADGTGFTSPVFDSTVTQNKVTFDAALCASGTSYYVKVLAINELGETAAQGSGSLLHTPKRLVVASFDFDSESDLQSYVKSDMVVHSNLKISGGERGIKINVNQEGDWMHCIVNIDKGANKGYDSLKFYMDMTEFEGSKIVVQLHDQNYESYSYTISVSSKKDYFEIPLSSFKKGTTAFDGRDVIRIAFNLEDYVGGSGDNLYLDDIEFTKG